MHEMSHRLAVALLFLTGVFTLWPLVPGVAGPLPQEAWAIAQHRQFLVALLGGGLVLAAFLPVLRLAAVGGAILSKIAFLVISLAAARSGVPLEPGQWLDAALLGLLLVAGLTLAREAHQHAHWEGRTFLRPEA